MQTRKKGTTEWFEGEGDQPTANINDLEAGQSYEFRVGAYCMDNVLSFSPIIDFTMPEKKSKDFQCGLEPNVDLSNKTPYTGTLNKGQEFMAGDFAVHVLEATGTASFTGKGWIKVPYLGSMRIAVEFKDIQLNTNLQLIAGEVKTTYDPEWKNILDVNEAIGDVKELANDVAQLYDDIKAFLNNYKGTEEDKKKAGEFEKDLNQNIQELLDNPNVSAEDKAKLVQSQNDNKEHWDALKTGKDCGGKEKSNGNGPNGVAYYNLEADFDCHTKPATEQAETVNTIAADAVKKGCTMPAMVRGCPDGTLENPLNDGNWQTVTALLNDLKKAIINKTSYTYTKNLNLDTGSQVSIGKTCFDPIYYDYSSMTESSKKVNAVSYTKEITTSVGGGSYWTLNFDGQLWIKIPKVVQASKDISKTKIDYLEKWLLCGKEEDAVATTTKPPIFPVTGKQLNDIFEGSDQNRYDEVAKLINKYSTEYGIDTAEKMSHFIGQIGAETQLKNLDEGSYSASRILTAEKTRTIRTHNGKKVLKYCSIFEGNSAKSSGCPYPYCDEDIVVPEGSYSGGYATIAFMQGMRKTVKPKMVDELPRDPDFFNTVYACLLDNDGIASGDGYRFRGRGFIQITGQTNYQTMVQDKWNQVHKTNKKDFMCRSAACDQNLDAIANDLDFSMLISLTFWKAGNTSELAKGVNKESIGDVTEAVNGKEIGIDNRTLYTNKAYEIFKK